MIADLAYAPTRTVTLTLDVPADLAERLYALPADTINRFTLAALPAVVEAAEEADDNAPDDLPADIYLTHPLPASLTESMAETARKVNADIAAGRVVDGDTVLAEIRALAGRK